MINHLVYSYYTQHDETRNYRAQAVSGRVGGETETTTRGSKVRARFDPGRTVN
jgi:hypothetical protein